MVSTFSQKLLIPSFAWLLGCICVDELRDDWLICFHSLSWAEVDCWTPESFWVWSAIDGESEWERVWYVARTSEPGAEPEILTETAFFEGLVSWPAVIKTSYSGRQHKVTNASSSDRRINWLRRFDKVCHRWKRTFDTLRTRLWPSDNSVWIQSSCI